MTTAACRFRRRAGRAPSMRARPCWRWAARAGRGSAPTADGLNTLAAKGVTVSPLKPANCGFTVAWSEVFRDRFEGQPLKGAALSFGPQTVRGEAMITRRGIEGGAVYALSAELRDAILGSGRATLHIALRPDLASRRSDRAAVVAPGKAIVVELVAQGRAAFARRHRPVAGGGDHVRASRCRRYRRKNSRSGSTPYRSNSTALRRSRAPSRPRAGSRSTNSTPISCSAVCPAPSPPAKCWTGKPRPAATCCRPRSRPAPQRGGDVLKWLDKPGLEPIELTARSVIWRGGTFAAAACSRGLASDWPSACRLC